MFKDLFVMFSENEIDEAAFRMLTLADLRVILQGKVGIQKKILEAIENLRIQPGKFDGTKYAASSTLDVSLRPAKPVQNNQKATANGPEKKERTAYDDMMHIQSLLQGYSLNDGLGKLAADKKKTFKNHGTSKVSSTTSAQQNGPGPGPSEPPRVFISQRILKRREKLPIFSMKEKFVEVMIC